MSGLSSPARPVVAPTASGGRPPVVELVGPAAAGKTTLLEELARLAPGWRLGMRLPVYAHLLSVAGLTPSFLALQRSASRVLWKEMKRMTYLRTLRRSVAAERTRRRGVVLDEGPVYMLARIRVYGGPEVRGPAFQAWWREVTAEWASTLDLLVWLDAPDSVLIERMRSRGRRHRMQAADDDTVRQFLGDYRRAYAELAASLAGASGLRRLEFRTDREPPGRIAEQIVKELRPRGAVA